MPVEEWVIPENKSNAKNKPNQYDGPDLKGNGNTIILRLGYMSAIEIITPLIAPEASTAGPSDRKR